MGNIDSRFLNEPFEACINRRQQNFLNYSQHNSRGTLASPQTTSLQVASTVGYPSNNNNQIYYAPDTRSRLIRDLTQDPSSTLSDIYEYILYRCNRNLDLNNKNSTKTNFANKLNNLIIKSYEKKLLEILKFKQNSNETILNKIMLKFNQTELNSYEFIRALVTTVCATCLDSMNRFDINFFRNRIKILSMFIYQNEELELQALYSIQDFSQQPDFLYVLYDLFYENDIISERVFMSVLHQNELNYMLSHSRKYSDKVAKLINESMTNNLIQFENSFVNQTNNLFNSQQPNELNYRYAQLEQSLINTILMPKSTNSNLINDENNSVVGINWSQSETSFDSIREVKPIETNSKTTNNVISSNRRDKEPECPVCMETFSDLKKDKKILMSTLCGHIMCKICSDNLFKISSKRSFRKKSIDCPVCRRNVDTTGIHEIFI